MLPHAAGTRHPSLKAAMIMFSNQPATKIVWERSSYKRMHGTFNGVRLRRITSRKITNGATAT
jgi:hypothetical protein